jgi:hypothetical protein
MASVEPHRDAIDVALFDAIHALIDEADKTETHQSWMLRHHKFLAEWLMKKTFFLIRDT